MPSILLNNDKDDWDESLPNALLADQVGKQSFTGNNFAFVTSATLL